MEKDAKKETNNEVEELKNQLKETKAKCDEYLNGWKRERADFLNYKKDEMERIGQLAKYANQEIILKIIPILDNVYLAEQHAPENNEWVQGFLQIKKQISDFLEKEGINPIDSIGKEFDPNIMESVGEISNSQFPNPNTVVEEVQRGYTMHGKVIRPAKVKISK